MAEKKITYEPGRPSTEEGATRIDEVWTHDRFALGYMGTGAGKTFMSIHAVGKIADYVHLIVITNKSQLDANYWQKSIDAYNKATNKHLAYDVYNYDILVRPKHQKEILKMINSLKQPACLILDEADTIANPTSKTFRFVRKIHEMPQIYRTVGLTATAIRNSILDACSYLILAGYYANKSQFYGYHVVKYDYFNNPVIKDKDGHQDLNLLNDPQRIISLLQRITVTVDTSKYMPKTYRYDYVFEYDPDTLQEYKQIKQDYKDGVYESPQKAIKAQIDFVAQHAKQQLAMLKQIIDNPNRPQTPILIFYQYDSELETLQEFIESTYADDFTIKYINGHNTKKEFVKPKETNTIFIIQYQSGGRGNDADWSSLSIFFSPSNGRTAYRQAVGRNIRAFQTGTTFQFRFIVKDTISAHKWFTSVDANQKFTSEFMRKYLADPNADEESHNIKSGMYETDSDYRKEHDSLLLSQPAEQQSLL